MTDPIPLKTNPNAIDLAITTWICHAVCLVLFQHYFYKNCPWILG